MRSWMVANSRRSSNKLGLQWLSAGLLLMLAGCGTESTLRGGEGEHPDSVDAGDQRDATVTDEGDSGSDGMPEDRRDADDDGGGDAPPALPTDGTWYRSTVNGGGGQLGLAVDPTDDNVAYISGDLGGIFKTTNKGKTWFSSQNNLGTREIASLRIDPLNHEVVYVTGLLHSSTATAKSNGEIYRSKDGGRSWASVYSQAPGSGKNIAFYINYKTTSSRNLLIPHDPSNPTQYDRDQNGVSDVILVVGQAGSGATNPHGSSGIWKSLDEGNTFTNKALATRNTCFVKADPNNPRTLYAGTVGDGLYRSTDLGDTWPKLEFTGEHSVLNSKSITDIAFNRPANPSDPHVIYISVDDSPNKNGHGGVYKSTDAGKSWEHVLLPSDPAFTNVGSIYGAAKQLLVDNRDPSGNTVIAGHRGAYSLPLTTNGGADWLKQEAPTVQEFDGPEWKNNPWFGNVFALDQGTDGTIYVARGRGASVFEGNAPGTDWVWHDRSTGIGNIVVNDVELDLGNPSTAYMTMSDSRAPFRTSNRGKTWTYIDDGFEVCRGTVTTLDKMQDVAVAKLDSQILFATGYAKHRDATTICKSTDGGQTWKPTCNGLPVTTPTNEYKILSVEISPTDSDIVLMATNETKIYRSTTGGQHWQLVESIPPTTSKFAFTNDGKTVVIGGGSNMYISNDHGVTWDSTTPKQGLTVQAVDVCPTNEKLLLAGVNIAGALISADQGKTWTPIFGRQQVTGHPAFQALALSDYARSVYSSTVRAVRFGPDNCDTIYLAHAANSPHYGLGLFKSLDKGTSWNKISTDSIFQSIRVIDLTADESALVVGGLEMGFRYEAL